MARLLLVRELRPFDELSVELCCLNGERIRASSRVWDFNVAKAIHRNLTPLPRWAIAAAVRGAPPWLRNHVNQAAALGLLKPGGEIYAPDGSGLGLSYQPEQGVTIHRDQIAMSPEEEDEYLD